MKKLLLLTISLFVGSIALAEKAVPEAKVQYKVSITNVTKGQPLTPPVVVSHKAGFKLFELGKEASEGLKLLALDGITANLTSELVNNSQVIATVSGSAVFTPGQSTELMLETSKARFVSIASMLARTNDAFVGGRYLRLPQRKGVKVAYLLSVYDAGAEVNTESCEHIPAPPCDSHNVGPVEVGGFVTAHPGVFGMADLDVLRDTFGKVAAKVVIEKL